MKINTPQTIESDPIFEEIHKRERLDLFMSRAKFVLVLGGVFLSFILGLGLGYGSRYHNNLPYHSSLRGCKFRDRY